MSIFDELASGAIAPDETSTRAFAARLARALPADVTLALEGELGAGKTTFVRGLAAAWNVPDTVTSPSFTVCALYQGDRLLAHVDAYRLSGPAAWESLMVEDFLRSPWCLVVEWPEVVREFLAPDALWVRIELLPDGTRRIRFVTPEPDLCARVHA